MLEGLYLMVESMSRIDSAPSFIDQFAVNSIAHKYEAYANAKAQD